MFKQEPKLVIHIEGLTAHPGLSIFKDNRWQFVDKPVNLFIHSNKDGKVDVAMFTKAMERVRCGPETGFLDLQNLSQVINRLILDKDLRTITDKFPILIGRNRHLRITLKVLDVLIPELSLEPYVEISGPDSIIDFQFRVLHNHVEVGRLAGQSHNAALPTTLQAYVNENYDLFNGTRSELSLINRALKVQVLEAIKATELNGSWTIMFNLGDFEFEIALERR